MAKVFAKLGYTIKLEPILAPAALTPALFSSQRL